MTDIEKAIDSLGTHSIALCKNGRVITSDGRGVAPLAEFLKNGTELSGFAAADRVVGKAAAMLMIKCGITEVFALTVSEAAEKLLKSRGIPVSFKERTACIMNRNGTAPCPMEIAVADIDDIEKGVEAIINKIY